MSEKELIIEKIHEYHKSNDTNEKSELKTQLIELASKNNIPELFETTVLAHYEGFKMSGIKTSIETMLRFIQ